METQLAKPKLLDQIRDRIRLKHYSRRTEDVYVDWAKRFILYHNKRHPQEMGKQEIEEFLIHLARDRQVSASTQNQAKAALLGHKDVQTTMIYTHVLNKGGRGVTSPLDRI